LLLTGYGAVLSYLSDATLVNGLLDSDPLSPDALARRREHVLDVLRTAVAP
jgi:TetR/AcrR family transcriptional regulator